MHKVEFLVDSKYTVVENDGVFYYTDENQKRVILPRFDDYTWAGGIDDAPILIVRNKKEQGYYNEKGDYTPLPKQCCDLCFSNGVAEIQKRNKYGLIDINGEIVIRPQFVNLGPFSAEGLACAKKHGRMAGDILI